MNSREEFDRYLEKSTAEFDRYLETLPTMEETFSQIETAEGQKPGRKRGKKSSKREQND